MVGAAVSSLAVLVVGGVLATGAAPSSNVFNGVDQVALQQCMAQRPPTNCEAVVPGLAQCMQQGLACNQTADSDRKATFGPAMPATDFGTPMTQEQAITAALGPNPPSSPTAARSMTYGAFLTLAGEQPDPDISLDRLVWVVTVHAPIRTPGTPQHPDQMKQVYTVVLDAASRQVIEVIAGLGLV